MRHKISGVNNFFPDVEESSSMLMQQSALRYFHPVLNASTHDEDRVCQFSPTSSAIGYHSNASLERAIAIRIYYYEADLPLYISWTFVVETSETCVAFFLSCVHRPTHANEPQDLMSYWTKVREIFIRHIVESSSMLTQQSALRSVHPLSNDKSDIKKESSISKT